MRYTLPIWEVLLCFHHYLCLWGILDSILHLENSCEFLCYAPKPHFSFLWTAPLLCHLHYLTIVLTTLCLLLF